jgi:predicted Zn finger-like uncharacterized protein
MRIACEVCRAEYDVDEAQLPAEGITVKCSRCLYTFAVMPPGIDLPAPFDPAERNLPKPASVTERNLPTPAGPDHQNRNLPAPAHGSTWQDADVPGWTPAGWNTPDEPFEPPLSAPPEPAPPPSMTQAWTGSPSAPWNPPPASPAPAAPRQAWDAPPPPLDPDLERIFAPEENTGSSLRGLDPDPTRVAAPPWQPPPTVRTPAPPPRPAAMPPLSGQGGELATIPTGAVHAPGARPAAAPAQAPVASVSPAVPTARERLDFSDLFGAGEAPASKRVDTVKYMVRRRDGTLLGPYDQVTLRAQLQTQRLARNEDLSTDGGLTWRPIVAFPEFSDLLQGRPARPSSSTDLAKVDISPTTVRPPGAPNREISPVGGIQAVRPNLDAVQQQGLGRSATGLDRGFDPLGGPSDPLGLGSDALGTTSDPLGLGSDPLGRGSDPLGRGSDPLGRGSDPLGRGSDPLGRGSDPLGRGSDPLGRASDPLGHAPAPPSKLSGEPAISHSIAPAEFAKQPDAARAPVPPRPAERPAWLAPAVTTTDGRKYAEKRASARRRRLLLIVLAGAVICGGAAFALLWEPGFEGEEAIRKRIVLDEAQLKRYQAQARAQMQIGTYRAYADARTKLASVVKSDPNDRSSKALYLHTMLYLMREYGQAAISSEAEKVRRELDRAGERGPDFQKAKVAYALWKRDSAEALRFLDRVLAAQPDDREALYLQGVALSTPKDAPRAVKVFDKLLGITGRNAKVLRAKAEAILLYDRPNGVATLRAAVEAAPGNAGTSIRLAETYFEDGRRDDAKRLFAWVVDPRTPARREAAPDELARAYSHLGRILLDQRDLEGARKQLEAALNTATSDAEQVRALLSLGDVLVRQRAYKTAIERLERALQKLPGSPDVLWRLAIAHSGAGETSKARQTVVSGLKALRLKRLDELPLRAKLEYYAQLANLSHASALVNERDEIPRIPEASSDYRAAIDAAQKVGGAEASKLLERANVGLAGLLRRQKNLQGALNALEAAKKIDPNSPRVHNGFGEVYADQGKPALAEAEFRKTIELDGQFLKARLNIANLFSEQGKLPDAIRHLEAVEKIDAKYPGLNLAMAIALQRQKRHKEAIEAFERAVKASPDDPRVYLRIGVAYFELGGPENLEKARPYLNKALEKNRQLNEAYYYRGRVLLGLQKPESAIDDFKSACEREPDNGVYRIYWGWALEQTSATRDAIFQYNRAIDLLRDQKNEVDIAFALYRRGRLKLEREELNAALKDLDEALKYDSANTEVLVLLGDSLAQARKHKQAVERYRAAIRRGGTKLRGLWFKLGKSLLEVNDRTEALHAMQNAAAEDTSDCYPHYYVGYLLKDAHQDAQAVRSLRRFLTLCKDPPERKDVLRDLYDMERRMGARKP